LTEWTTTEHAERYLARQDTIPHRTEGEAVLLAHIPGSARRILDLGTGDGRLIALLRLDRPDIEAPDSISQDRCSQQPGSNSLVRIGSRCFTTT
jgi:hypothetical protein